MFAAIAEGKGVQTPHCKHKRTWVAFKVKVKQMHKGLIHTYILSRCHLCSLHLLPPCFSLSLTHLSFWTDTHPHRCTQALNGNGLQKITGFNIQKIFSPFFVTHSHFFTSIIFSYSFPCPPLGPFPPSQLLCELTHLLIDLSILFYCLGATKFYVMLLPRQWIAFNREELFILLCGDVIFAIHQLDYFHLLKHLGQTFHDYGTSGGLKELGWLAKHNLSCVVVWEAQL